MSPDPKAEWWTVDDVAEYLGLAHLTVIQYHQDRMIPYRDRRSSTLLWRPRRIIEWAATTGRSLPSSPSG